MRGGVTAHLSHKQYKHQERVCFFFILFFTTRGRHSNLKGCRKIKGYRLIFNFFFPLTIIIFHTTILTVFLQSLVYDRRRDGCGTNGRNNTRVFCQQTRCVRSIYINYLSVNASLTIRAFGTPLFSFCFLSSYTPSLHNPLLVCDPIYTRVHIRVHYTHIYIYPSTLHIHTSKYVYLTRLKNPGPVTGSCLISWDGAKIGGKITPPFKCARGVCFMRRLTPRSRSRRTTCCSCDGCTTYGRFSFLENPCLSNTYGSSPVNSCFGPRPVRDATTDRKVVSRRGGGADERPTFRGGTGLRL